MKRTQMKFAASLLISLAIVAMTSDARAGWLFGPRKTAPAAAPTASVAPPTQAPARTPAPAATPAPAQTPAGAAPAAPEIGDVETALKQAQLSRNLGDFDNATKILSQLVLFAPDDPRVLGEYGKTLVSQGKSDDALAFLERAIQLNPGEWSFYSAQGVAYDQKGIYNLAQDSYARALRLKPGEATVLNNDALSHIQSGDLDSAEKLLQQASPGSANNPRIAQNMALLQSLKASRPRLASARAPARANTPAPPAQAATPMPVETAVAPLPAPVEMAPIEEPKVASAMPPAAMEMPAANAIESSPETAAVADTPMPPAPESETSVAPSVAALQSDPHVMIQAVPKDAQAGPRPTATKPATRKPVAASAKTPAQAPAAAKPAAERRVVVAGGGSTYYVQAGAFATEERADQIAQSLDSMGARVTPATVDGRAVYRVRIGPFLDVRQANAALNQAQALGHQDLRLVSE